jgi:hypothetical protein
MACIQNFKLIGFLGQTLYLLEIKLSQLSVLTLHFFFPWLALNRDSDSVIYFVKIKFDHRKYIRIDITTLGRGHGRVCLADGNTHKVLS